MAPWKKKKFRTRICSEPLKTLLAHWAPDPLTSAQKSHCIDERNQRFVRQPAPPPPHAQTILFQSPKPRGGWVGGNASLPDTPGESNSKRIGELDREAEPRWGGGEGEGGGHLWIAEADEQIAPRVERRGEEEEKLPPPRLHFQRGRRICLALVFFYFFSLFFFFCSKKSRFDATGLSCAPPPLFVRLHLTRRAHVSAAGTRGAHVLRGTGKRGGRRRRRAVNSPL